MATLVKNQTGGIVAVADSRLGELLAMEVLPKGSKKPANSNYTGYTLPTDAEVAAWFNDHPKAKAEEFVKGKPIKVVALLTGAEITVPPQGPMAVAKPSPKPEPMKDPKK